MLEFIVNNYILFIIIAVVLLLGLFGYIMDKKKYEQYRKEIVNEERALDMIDNQSELGNIAAPVLDQADIYTPNTAPDLTQENQQ